MLIRGSFLFLLFTPALGFAQDLIAIANKSVDEEQQAFRQFAAAFPMDRQIRTFLEDFGDRRVDSIQTSISENQIIRTDLRARCIRSLTFFMRGVSENLRNHKLNSYVVPDMVDKYIAIQNALLEHKPFSSYFSALGPDRCQVMANALWQFNFSDHMEELATFKRVADAPEFLFSFLENNPNFYYRDSLLLLSVREQPNRLIEYLRRNRNTLTEKMQEHPDSSVQKVLALVPERNASEIVPFAEQILDSTLSDSAVLAIRKNVRVYFQLIVDNIIANNRVGIATAREGFQPALRLALREKSLDFYIHSINELHSRPDAQRFASVKALRPQDLYYIILSGQDELYTSSYLGLFKRMMAFYPDSSAQNLLDSVGHDGLRSFMRLAANYNTLPDFLNHMSDSARQAVIRQFIGHIYINIEDGLNNAMDVADAFPNLAQDSLLSELVQQALAENLERSEAEQSFYGMRIYHILQQVYTAIDRENGIVKSDAVLGNYQELPIENLTNDSGHIEQVVLFYGDADGKQSFKSFLSLFKDSKRWQINYFPSWIKVQSLNNPDFLIYANQPLDNETGEDLAAQDSLYAYFKENDIHPSVLIHRGHSYHLKYSLKRLDEDVRLAVLGSCGSYNNILSVANISPSAQIIASKQVGSMLVNDPLLDIINRKLLEQQNLVWNNVWQDLSKELQKNKAAYSLFQEYVPPSKNIGLFVLKLYNYEVPR